MGGFFKIINSALGILAVIVCLATVGIIVYSSTHPNMGGSTPPTAAANPTVSNQTEDVASASEAPSPVHVHNYAETIDLQATCIAPGRLKYTCECGDYYYTDIPLVGHLAGDWETVTEATETKDGLRVKKCIYCDEVLNQEIIPATAPSGTSNQHVHEYIPSIESEATCTVAGIRKYTCSCGSYYRENIHAIGHLAGGWEVMREATTTDTGFEQRICNVCLALLDYRETPKLAGTPSPSGTPGASGTASSSPSSSPTPTPTATPHTHNYVWHELRSATCSSIGIRTGNCSCGDEKQERIDIIKDAHTYVTTVIPPTIFQKGYTLQICSLCGNTKTSNEVPALPPT